MNELLRFKAATDDYPMALGNEAAHRSVVGIFGGVGEASDAVRSHAYLQGGAGPLTAMGKAGQHQLLSGAAGGWAAAVVDVQRKRPRQLTSINVTFPRWRR